MLEHIAHMRRVARFVSDSRVFLLTTRNAHAMPPPSDFVTYYFTNFVGEAFSLDRLDRN